MNDEAREYVFNHPLKMDLNIHHVERVEVSNKVFDNFECTYITAVTSRGEEVQMNLYHEIGSLAWKLLSKEVEE